MVAYSFKPRFVGAILSGTKRQTIRADRKRHARVGEEIQLYTGMRTRQCQSIGRAICESVVPIRLDLSLKRGEIDLPDRLVCMQQDLDAFARMDGFSDWWEMRGFWLEEHDTAGPWSGILIRWTGLTTLRGAVA